VLTECNGRTESATEGRNAGIKGKQKHCHRRIRLTMDAGIEELQKVAKSRSWLAAKEAFARLRFQLSVRQQMKYPERQSRGGVGFLLGGC